MTKQEILDGVASALMPFIKETANKDKKATSDAELTAMTEAAKILVDIASYKVS